MKRSLALLFVVSSFFALPAYPFGQNKIASLYRSLLRAGFSSDAIRAELRGVTHGDLPELPDALDTEL